jgi:hypothetical protein
MEVMMEILLQRHEILDLGHGLRDLRIVCREGRCWLTQEGDSRDFILRSGHSLAIESAGQVLITASESCRLQIVGANRSASVAGRLPALISKKLCWGSIS